MHGLFRLPQIYREAEGAGAPAGGAPAGGAPAPAAAVAAPAAPAPAAAAAAAAAAPVLGFADSLPEGIRNDPIFKDIKDLDGLAKSYHGASKLLGNRDPKTLFQVPTDPNDPAAVAPIYDALGRPKDAKSYQLTEYKLPEGLSVNTERQGKFLEQAHALGLNNRQADALMQWYNGEITTEYTAINGQKTKTEAEGMATLEKDWGPSTGEPFKVKLSLMEAALAQYGSPELIAELEKNGRGNNPELVKAFAKIGETLAEPGKLPGGNSGARGGAFTPTEAQQQIGGLMNDAAFVKQWRNKDAPGHADAVTKMAALYGQAYPDQAATA